MGSNVGSHSLIAVDFRAPTPDCHQSESGNARRKCFLHSAGQSRNVRLPPLPGGNAVVIDDSSKEDEPAAGEHFDRLPRASAHDRPFGTHSKAWASGI